MSITITGAGILPYAYFNNTIYFLLGREHKEAGWDGSDKWSDFGGSVEEKHKEIKNLTAWGGTAEDYPKYTAAIEFWEETMGLFKTPKQIFDILKESTTLVHINHNYAEHLIKIDYNPFWLQIFRNAYNYVSSCTRPHPSKSGYNYIPSCPSGFVEKTDIKWVSYDELKHGVDTYKSSSTSEYRNYLIQTASQIFALPAFAKILDDSNIFKKLEEKTIAPPTLPAAPIVPPPTDTTPSFYPKNADAISQLMSNIDIMTQYVNLFHNLPYIYSKPSLWPIFEYIDLCNQIHYDIKKFIDSKLPKNKHSMFGIHPFAYFSGHYCPLEDKSITSKILGSGSYGTTYKLTNSVIPSYMAKPFDLVVKVVNDAPNLAQLSTIPFNNGTSTPPNNPTMITDLYSAEVAALSLCNYLVESNQCYNVPSFYGSITCNENKKTYLYMQMISQSFHSQASSATSTEWDSILLQGLFTLLTFSKYDLCHGDINQPNLVFDTLLPTVTKRPLYKIGDDYIYGQPTNKILYFIDFGMPYRDGFIEPTARIQKDQARINNNINWSPIRINPKTLNTKPMYESYKGYYTRTDGKDDKQNTIFKAVALIRRRLLDCFLLFETIKYFTGTKYEKLSEQLYDVFFNPVYYLNHMFSIKVECDQLIMSLIGKLNLSNIFENNFPSLNGSQWMYLGNYQYPVDQLTEYEKQINEFKTKNPSFKPLKEL